MTDDGLRYGVDYHLGDFVPPTLTLTDFLLTRIAEDEAAANDARRLQDYMPSGAWDLDRVLAECEAKRRIVADAVLAAENYEEVPWSFTEGRLNHGVDDMRHLASVYADHPDFREEWKL